jgi:6-phosphofructokinase 1
VGVPGTIDSDCQGADYTIGFDTAVNTALEVMDRIHDTAISSCRIFFEEMMGRHTGFVTLESGIAGGAEELLIPEAPVDTGELWKRNKKRYRSGSRRRPSRKYYSNCRRSET